MPQRIAIIAGAGPAGLTAAYELLKRTNIRPIVCESTDAIGGIAQTYNYKGNRIDVGGHRFFSKSDRVMQWWFNILPRQGAPAADTVEKGHEIEYVSEAIVEYLCKECAPATLTPTPLPKGEGLPSLTPTPLPKGEGLPPVGGSSFLNSQFSILNSSPLRIQKPAPDPEKEDLVMLHRPRVSRIFYRKNFFPYPIAITLLVARRLGILNTMLIGGSYLWRQAFPINDETMLDAFYKNRFGDRLYRTFFEAYTEKVWGVPCSQIKSDWGAQRVKGLSLKRALTHAVKDLLSSDFNKRQQERETSLITRFFYPKFGPGQMWETVAGQVKTCGGEIRMHTRVSGVHVEGQEEGQRRQRGQKGQGQEAGVVAVTIENVETGEQERIACDYFFSTMPIKHLIGMMTPHPDARVTEVAEGLHYRDFLTVGLLLKDLHVQERGKNPSARVPDNWIYIQEGGVRVGRVQIFNNWSPYMVKDWRGTVWIGLEYFVNEGGDLWIMEDTALIELGITEVEKIGIIRRADVLDGCVLRMPKAYPAYIGSYDQLHVVRKFVEKIPNLFLIGRNGMHRYNNQDHSMLTAMLAVDNIVAGRTDKSNLWEVNLDGEYHEEKNT